ncbi:MAG: hypothetical protein M1569_01190 [Candidatus Marsarchaeota archaeon]|nr:hypothetical protein [Candidatus Marsarchaeota archaeon]MCL5413003.1 hypothetical protein [Candidatus Marsarchaeota archaeon]
MKFASIIALMAAFGMAHAGTSTLQFAPSSAFNNWVPIVGVGILLGVMISVIYYLIGWFLGNARLKTQTFVKSNALNELEQTLGTVLIVIIILGVLYSVGTGESLAFSNILSNNAAKSITNICKTYLPKSQISFLANTGTLYGQTQLLSPTTQVCHLLYAAGSTSNQNLYGVSSSTANIDYGLAATYTILANLTNQSAVNLNSIFHFESLLFFFRDVNVYTTVCLGDQCALPIAIPELGPKYESEVKLSAKPFDGYVLHRLIMPTITTEGTLMLYLYLFQMILILLLLLLWPYLLVAGILLRTVSYTRRIGGLLIAVVVVALLIYPTIFLIEYSALSNASPPLPLLGLPVAPGSQITQQATLAQAPGLSQDMPDAVLCGAPPGWNSENPGTGLYCYVSSSVTSLPSSIVFRGLQMLCTGSNELQPSGYPCISSLFASNQPTWHLILNYILLALPGVGTSALGIQSVLAETTLPPIIYNCNDIPQSSNNGKPDSTHPCFTARNLNFYVFPSAKDIINLYSYYPTSVVGTELEYTIFSVVTFQGAQSILDEGLSVMSGGYIAALPVLPASYYPQNVSATMFALINMYGIQAVTGFILPILNLLMLISSITGLSTLMGGETNILGISRFI